MTGAESEPPHRLRALIVKLDGQLTGRPEDAARNAAQRASAFTHPLEFLVQAAAGTYYLADGGYSRLLFGDDGSVLGVDAVSRPEVKARWDTRDVQETAAEISRILRDAVADAGS